MVKFTARTLLIAAGIAVIPDVSVAGANLRFVDFQNNCIDLVRNTVSSDAPQAAAIGTYPCASRTTTVQWTTTLTGGTNFNITSTALVNIVLSVAAVGATLPSSSQPLIDQPVLGRVGSAMSWKFVANPNFSGKFKYIKSIGCWNPAF
ncbi:hypothetical protein BJ165DRAFT_738799 [Panaeolus papilionaceus]|nr:hypothetical protein BJ165DRAFT_738799 [Panaeolus papilionaceus]